MNRSMVEASAIVVFEAYAANDVTPYIAKIHVKMYDLS